MVKNRTTDIEDVSEPFCGVRRKNLIPLSVAHPDIAAEWYYPKNAGWGPEDLSRGSQIRVWWQCSFCNRDYKASIANRTGKNRSACPYCASKKVCEDNSLVDFHPDIAREFHPTKNKKLKVTDLLRASQTFVWWLCSKCNHSWRIDVATRTSKQSGCPACYQAKLAWMRENPNINPTPQIILNENSVLSDWYSYSAHKGFVSLQKYSKALAAQWHPTKNGQVKPEDISKGADAIAWWKCNEGPDHEWQAAVYSRTSDGNKNAICPFCNNYKLSQTNSLAYLNPELASELHPTKNGDLTGSDIKETSQRKVWWLCVKNPEHEWDATVWNRTSNKSGCPYCAGRKRCWSNSLAFLHPQTASCWDKKKNGKLTPEDVSPHSKEIVWWRCNKRHTWQQTVQKRVTSPVECWECLGKNPPKSKRKVE